MKSSSLLPRARAHLGFHNDCLHATPHWCSNSCKRSMWMNILFRMLKFLYSIILDWLSWNSQGFWECDLSHLRIRCGGVQAKGWHREGKVGVQYLKWYLLAERQNNDTGGLDQWWRNTGHAEVLFLASIVDLILVFGAKMLIIFSNILGIPIRDSLSSFSQQILKRFVVYFAARPHVDQLIFLKMYMQFVHCCIQLFFIQYCHSSKLI